MPKTSREIVQEELAKWEEQQLLIRRRNREKLEALETRVNKVEHLAGTVRVLLANLILSLEAHVDTEEIEDQLRKLSELTNNWNDGEEPA